MTCVSSKRKINLCIRVDSLESLHSDFVALVIESMNTALSNQVLWSTRLIEVSFDRKYHKTRFSYTAYLEVYCLTFSRNISVIFQKHIDIEIRFLKPQVKLNCALHIYQSSAIKKEGRLLRRMFGKFLPECRRNSRDSLDFVCLSVHQPFVEPRNVWITC